MHAFDYVIVLFSFVYAAAVTHVLGTLGDIIIAGRRVRVSWFNLGWMVLNLMSILAWWMGTWELRQMRTWDAPFILFNFAMACALYVVVRLTCPAIPEKGPVDLPEFHQRQGRKYLVALAAFGAVAMTYNALYDLGSDGTYFLRQNIAAAPMVVGAGVAAVYIRKPRVQVACLVVEFASWAVYLLKFQGVLSG